MDDSVLGGFTVVIVPGLRDAVEDHWQTQLAAELPSVRTVPPMGRKNLDCRARVKALEREVQAVEGAVVLVAHSGGVATVSHWARLTQRPIAGALLATPADLDMELPEGYPTPAELGAAGWLPVPRRRLPFPSIVAASRNDPLASFDRVAAMSRALGSRLVDLGNVGHLNPAWGYGPWPRAHELIADAVTHAAIAQFSQGATP